MNKKNAAAELHKRIRQNRELQQFEIKGFLRGAEKGKTMNVTFEQLVQSLTKQYDDFIHQLVYYYTSAPTDLESLKQKIADVRNVAGCLFLVVQRKHAKNPMDLPSLFTSRFPK